MRVLRFPSEKQRHVIEWPSREALRVATNVDVDAPRPRRWQVLLTIGFYFLAVFLLITIIKGLPE